MVSNPSCTVDGATAPVTAAAWCKLLAHKVPDEDRLLEETGGLEAVMEELLQRAHQTPLAAQQQGQAAPLIG